MSPSSITILLAGAVGAVAVAVLDSILSAPPAPWYNFSHPNSGWVGGLITGMVFCGWCAALLRRLER